MLPKLHLVCSSDATRLTLNYVRIGKDFIVATNSHVLAKIPTKNTALPHDVLPEEPIFVHRDSFKALTAASVEAIGFVPEKSQFVAIHKGNKANTVVPYAKAEELDGRYPDYDNVIPTWDDGAPVDLIGLNPKLLNDLYEAIRDPNVKAAYGSVALRLFAPNRAILVRSFGGDDELDALGLIMPSMLPYRPGNLKPSF